VSTSTIAPLLDAIAAALAWLRANDIDAAIVGGVAVAIRGRPRMTKDVDFLALADIDAWPRLVASATAHGLEPRIPDVLDFASTTRVLLMRHTGSGVEIDISLGALPFELALVHAATLVSVAGQELPVARADDLVIMKSLALRPRDIADIEGLLETTPQLDLSHIRRQVEEFAHALDEMDIVGELDRIVEKVRSREP